MAKHCFITHALLQLISLSGLGVEMHTKKAVNKQHQSAQRKFVNCNLIFCFLQIPEDFAHLIMWNNFRIKRKACQENTTVRVTPANKFVSEDYCSCFLRCVCYRRSVSSKCFFVEPLIIFQWKDFFQTCLSPHNSSSNDDSEDLDALKRPCSNWRENKMALKMKKGQSRRQ